MAKVYVKFYPPFLRFAKEGQIEVELNEGTRFVDILYKLADTFPNFKEAIPDVNDNCIFYNNMVPVINNRVVGLQEALNDGDEVCLFGSISGG